MPTSHVASDDFGSESGWAMYFDSTTAGTPISATAGAWTTLTCDGAGGSTVTSQLPESAPALWDTTNNWLLFAGISDEVLIEVETTVTISPTQAGQIVDARIAVYNSTPTLLWNVVMTGEGTAKALSDFDISFRHRLHLGGGLRSGGTDYRPMIELHSDKDFDFVVSNVFVEVTAGK